MSLWKEFMDFIKKQNVLSVALGLIVGFAAKDLVNSLIADLIAPIYEPYLGFGPEATIPIGLSEFNVGHFIQSFISFLVVLFVVFIIAKKVVKTK